MGRRSASTGSEGPAFNLADVVDVELRVVVGSRGAIQPHVWRVPIDGLLSGPGRATCAAAGGREGPRAGIQDPNIASLPAFTISGYQGFSGNAGDGRPKWQDRGEYELIDSLTWIKGKHILKFGGRMYHRNILFTDARSHNGAFNYTGVMTQRPSRLRARGTRFADFMLGYPASVDAVESCDLVGRNRHVLARLLPGRLPVDEQPDA